MSDANTAVETKEKAGTKPEARDKSDQLPPYHVVLLDDNDHSYEYVIEMLVRLFGHSVEKSFLLAEQVDRLGRAIVCTTHKERAELKRDQIMGFGGDQRMASSKCSMQAQIEPGC